ncbi:MAG: DsrE family protein [Gammaproteobacteria bacterium]|nr:DsrE family protein [Gammaproteobacteria bacterium]MDH5776626.1 DsrE family protein [Gammaproteobacteria bacterium]
MKKLLLSISLLSFMFLGPLAPSIAEDDDTMKVVYHADFADPRRMSAMITSITNMVTTYTSDLIEFDVRIVFVAHGIRFLTQDKLAKTPFAEDAKLAKVKASIMERLAGLEDVYGVKLELCDITRQGIKLKKEKLMPKVNLVRSGVVQIATLQKKGFAYLKVE